MMEAKASQTTSWDVICSPPWEKQRRWVPAGLKVGHKCTKSTQELKDGFII